MLEEGVEDWLEAARSVDAASLASVPSVSALGEFSSS
jgi:hypothetical protein